MIGGAVPERQILRSLPLVHKGQRPRSFGLFSTLPQDLRRFYAELARFVIEWSYNILNGRGPGGRMENVDSPAKRDTGEHWLDIQIL
jgi:hypothetical protein